MSPWTWILALVELILILDLAQLAMYGLWRKFRWDLFYAAGAVSIIVWVTWLSANLDHILINPVITFAWPAITICGLFLLPQPDPQPA